jgi:hypothetical protein
MRNYKILAAKAAEFDSNPEIVAACAAAGAEQLAEPTPAFSSDALAALRAEDFSAVIKSREGRHHEHADQLLLELLLGI